MSEDAHLGDGTPGLESLRRLHLMVVLRDLVEERGRMRAAEDLGISYQTLARCLKSGRKTQTMERVLLSRRRESDERSDERLTALEGRMDAVEERASDAVTRGDLQEAVEGVVERRMEDLRRELRKDVIEGMQDDSGAAAEAGGRSDAVDAPRSSRGSARAGSSWMWRF